MSWVFAILVVLAMGGIALVAAGRGAPMADEYDDRPDAVVPASGVLRGEDLRRVRFSLAFRGYRMSEVDALLDRLAGEREQEEAVRAAWNPDSHSDEADSDDSDDSDSVDADGVEPPDQGEESFAPPA